MFGSWRRHRAPSEPEALSKSRESEGPEERNSITHPPPNVEELRAVSNMGSHALNRLALGGDKPDEIIPTAEGMTFFTGERSQIHKASETNKTLLQERLDLVKGVGLGKRTRDR